MAFGVTAIGFVKKTLQDITTDKEASARSLFGSDVDLTPTSPLKKFIDITSLEEVRLWEMSETLYDSAYLLFSSGQNLDRVVEIIGVDRKPAVKATGSVTFSGTDGTDIPQGTRVATVEGVEFVTDALGTIAAGSVSIAVTANVAGISGNVAANTVTQSLDIIFGVTSVNNPAAMSNGVDRESDAALRDRAPGALAAVGKATVAALKAAILAITGVTFVAISEDFDRHEVTAVIDGVTLPNTDIDAAVLDTRSAGIDVIVQAATLVTIFVDLAITYDGTEPTDANDLVETSIIDYITGLGIGNDVVYSKLFDVIFNTGSYVSDVTDLFIGTAYPPLTEDDNIVIASTTRSQTDKTRIGFLPYRDLSANFTVA